MIAATLLAADLVHHYTSLLLVLALGLWLRSKDHQPLHWQWATPVTGVIAGAVLLS